MNNINCLKTQQFAESTNVQQQSRFFQKNSMMPSSLLSLQQPQFLNKKNGFADSHFRFNTGTNSNNGIVQYHQQAPQLNNAANNLNFNGFGRQRFAPYYNKRNTYANALMQSSNRFPNFANQSQVASQVSSSPLDIENSEQINTVATTSSPTDSVTSSHSSQASSNTNNGTSGTSTAAQSTNGDGGAKSSNNCVTLQISNLDTTIEESELKQFLINRLKPITSVLSIYFEGLSVAKIKLPSAQHAKQVIAYLHRKKIGHKRITVSYTRESSTLEPSTLRCQVAGLLKVRHFFKLFFFII